VLEEAPRFVPWFNSLVTPGIDERTFLAVNGVGMAVTILITAAVASSSEPAAGAALAAWVGFLMLANGLFHLVATMVHGRYCPGVVTGTLIYLPYGVLLLRGIVRSGNLCPASVAACAALGAVPMLVHGYLIVFRGSRLF
jgi:hypothetical protein